MSTAASDKHFVIVVNDFTDPDALSRRMSVRDSHLAGATCNKNAGFLLSGGAILDSHDSGKMIGSSLIVKAASEEAVWEKLKQDPYVTGKVWDLSTAKIFAYKPASF
ncbi:hypothetical protein FBU59_005630 [Linderina macrospora]|uniref:Uncharacterized protein n=1 Tax=Linderina macrospora TaxID=4868 RepID=A0ACC1J248_9FUNG|nr:hypothetical protein FBU59_005630 [Linderina macrospora]